MDPTRALLAAARGIRAALGRFAPLPYQLEAVQYVEEIAAALVEDAGLSCDESATAEGLLLAAAERRIADLVPRDFERRAIAHQESCPPGCAHIAYLLVCRDRDAVRFATNKAAFLRAHGRGNFGFPFVRREPEDEDQQDEG
jgi:hypothetical protein